MLVLVSARHRGGSLEHLRKRLCVQNKVSLPLSFTDAIDEVDLFFRLAGHGVCHPFQLKNGNSPSDVHPSRTHIERQTKNDRRSIKVSLARTQSWWEADALGGGMKHARLVVVMCQEVFIAWREAIK